MMIKIAGMLMVISSLTMLGFKMSMKLSYRFESLKKVKKLLLLLKGEIKYKNSMLEEAFAGLAENMENPYGDFALNLSESLKNRDNMSYNEIVVNNIEKLNKNSCLSDTDTDKFSDFLENLGYLDKEMQIANIDMYLEELELSMEESLNDIRRNGRLYKLMGTAAGILICLFTA